MKVIGLTGGILTGKSTISQMLAEKGAVIIDADKVGHQAYQPHTEIWREVVAAFGRGILKEGGDIDRKKLAQIVFNDHQALAKLNGIMHPRMHDMIGREIERLRKDGTKTVVLEAAILIEAHWTDLVDEIWVSVAPEASVIKRLQDRGGLTEEQAKARIRSQISTEERLKHANVIVDTNCTLAEVKAKVDELWKALQSRKN